MIVQLEDNCMDFKAWWHQNGKTRAALDDSEAKVENVAFAAWQAGQRAAVEDQRYNGWKNHETWAVHLWLTNDQGDYNHWNDEARDVARSALDIQQVKDGIWEPREGCRITLAERLKDQLTDAQPDLGATLWADLFGSALSEVDWFEVAVAFLDECDVYNALPKDKD
jgi:hypothetical protein